MYILSRPFEMLAENAHATTILKNPFTMTSDNMQSFLNPAKEWPVQNMND